jgi:hypothetical protein
LTALKHGRSRDAEVARAGLTRDREAAVLRPAFVGDVEAGHDLEPREQLQVQLDRDLAPDLEPPVDAHADHDLVALRLDVDVARALLERDLEALINHVLYRLFGFTRRRRHLGGWIFHAQLKRIAAGTARSPSARGARPQMCVRRLWCMTRTRHPGSGIWSSAAIIRYHREPPHRTCRASVSI